MMLCIVNKDIGWWLLKKLLRKVKYNSAISSCTNKCKLRMCALQ